MGITFNSTGGAMILDSAQPASGTYAGITVLLTAADTVAFGDVCYINSSGQAKLAKADAIANANATLMAVASITSTQSGLFLLMGTVTHSSLITVTAGALVYLSATGTTGNTLATTAPSGSNNVIQILGHGIATHTMLFNPSLIQVEHT